MRQQKSSRTHGVHHGGGGVDCDGHRVNDVVRVAADQTDGVPVVCQAGRIGVVEHRDDVGEADAHRSPSARASISTGHSSLTVARR